MLHGQLGVLVGWQSRCGLGWPQLAGDMGGKLMQRECAVEFGGCVMAGVVAVVVVVVDVVVVVVVVGRKEQREVWAEQVVAPGVGCADWWRAHLVKYI